MKEVEWNDGMASRSRHPYLVLIDQEGEAQLFRKKDIAGVCVIKGTDYEKNGKWSNTTYRLLLTDSIRHIAFYDGWNTGSIGEGLAKEASKPTPDTWLELADCLDMSVPATQRFIRKEFKPLVAEHFDEVEAKIEGLETSEVASAPESGDSETVIVSFGSPTNKGIREGYWESPKTIPGYEAEIRLIDREKGWNQDNIIIVGISGQVLSIEHCSGMHGGSYAVKVAVIPGTEVPLPAFKTHLEKETEASKSKKENEEQVPFAACH